MCQLWATMSTFGRRCGVSVILSLPTTFFLKTMQCARQPSTSDQEGLRHVIHANTVWPKTQSLNVIGIFIQLRWWALALMKQAWPQLAGLIDILCLQQHWLSDAQMNVLNDVRLCKYGCVRIWQLRGAAWTTVRRLCDYLAFQFARFAWSPDQLVSGRLSLRNAEFYVNCYKWWN